jgi:hypothetical protein
MAATPTAASAAPESPPGDGSTGTKVVHVYDSLWSNNPRRRSNRKIERHVTRWQGRGYRLAGLDDNRVGDSGVLRATLTFHRVST